MADIILGNSFKLYYNTDTGKTSLQGIGNIEIDNLAAFPTLTISSSSNQFDTYDSEYLSTLLSEQTVEPLSISIHYVPDNAAAQFLDDIAESQQEFQLVLQYDYSDGKIAGAVVNGYIQAFSLSGDKDDVVTKTYTFVHSDVVMRSMSVTALNPVYQGDYGIGSNGADVGQYQPDVPAGNSFIKVPASQSGNLTSTDLMGIGLVDGTNVAEFAMTKSGTLSLFAKNANTAWTRIYTVTQMDSTYVPLSRTVNGKPLSGNIVLNASDLAGGTMTGALTVPALTVTGTTTLSGNTAAAAVTATSLTSTGGTTTTGLSVSGETKLTGVTTAGTVKASDLTLVNALPTSQGGTGNTNGTVGQLTTARTFITNLASTTASTFNGTANNSHGVTGILSVANGGTGNSTGTAPTATLAASATVLATARNITTDLGSTSAASFNGSANITPGISGTLSITNGGTGATNAVDAAYNLATMPRRGNMPDGANCNDYGPASTTIGIWSIGTVAATANANLPEATQGVFEVLQAGPYSGTQRFITRYGKTYIRALTAAWTAASPNVWGPWVDGTTQVVGAFFNGDLNTLITPGYYAVTAAATNSPLAAGVTSYVTVKARAVAPLTTFGDVIQECEVFSGNVAGQNRVWRRYYSASNTTWTTWNEQAIAGDSVGDNYIRNPGFLSNGFLQTFTSTSATIEYVDNTDSRVPAGCPGQRVALITKTATGTLHQLNFGVANDLHNSYIPVAPGDILNYSVDINGTGLTANTQLRAVIVTYNGTTAVANQRVASYDGATGGWQRLSGSYTIPSGVTQCYFGVWNETVAPTGSVVCITQPSIRKQDPNLVAANNGTVNGTLTNTYRITQSRTDANPPYITWNRADQVDGTLPSSNTTIGFIQGMLTDSNGTPYGRVIGNMSMVYKTTGGGITAISGRNAAGSTTSQLQLDGDLALATFTGALQVNSTITASGTINNTGSGTLGFNAYRNNSAVNSYYGAQTTAGSVYFGTGSGSNFVVNNAQNNSNAWLSMDASNVAFSGALTVPSATVTGAISAGSLALTTALPVTSGGTGATTTAAARTNLGFDALGIGISLTPYINPFDWQVDLANMVSGQMVRANTLTWTNAPTELQNATSYGVSINCIMRSSSSRIIVQVTFDSTTTVGRVFYVYGVGTAGSIVFTVKEYYTSGSLIPIANGGTGNSTGLAASATILATARTITTNLASTTAASFNGSANVTPGVSGILPIANGGTGNATGLAATATSLATSRSFITDLSSTASTSFNGTADVTHGVTGTLSIANGGTGATTAAAARTALGVAYGTATGTVTQGNDSRLLTVGGKTGGDVSSSINVTGPNSAFVATAAGVGTESSNTFRRMIYGYVNASQYSWIDAYVTSANMLTRLITVNGSTYRTFNFYDTGNATCDGSWIGASDERMKDKITLVPDALNAVLSWRGVTYQKKDGDHEVGLIAQDIEKDCPEAIVAGGKREFSDGTVIEDLKMLNTAGVSAAYHTEAIKELYAMIVELKNEIEVLKNQ